MMRTRYLIAVLGVVSLPLTAAPALAATTERVSLSNDGAQGDGESNFLDRSISADGRFVAFSSPARNLVADDTNGTWDVFVRDRLLGTTERVSVSNSGEQANGGSGCATISADGRIVGFDSEASNLAPGDANGVRDSFVRDRSNKTTELVSVSVTGAQGNDTSAYSFVSSDGRFVVFNSAASNLVPGDTYGTNDVFVRDRVAQITECVSVSVMKGGAPVGGVGHESTTPDGRFVAFWSESTDLVPGDTNRYMDVFLRDRVLGSTERVNVSSEGEQANGQYVGSPATAVSARGRFVAFASSASNLVPDDTNRRDDIFVRDRQAHTTERVSVSSDGAQGNGHCMNLRMTPDARFVAFSSYSSNLVPGDTNGLEDVFVRDRRNATADLVSVSTQGRQANKAARNSSITPDGRFVVFDSKADDLVPGDTNRANDVFVRDRYGEPDAAPPPTETLLPQVQRHPRPDGRLPRQGLRDNTVGGVGNLP